LPGRAEGTVASRDRATTRLRGNALAKQARAMRLRRGNRRLPWHTHMSTTASSAAHTSTRRTSWPATTGRITHRARHWILTRLPSQWAMSTPASTSPTTGRADLFRSTRRIRYIVFLKDIHLEPALESITPVRDGFLFGNRCNGFNESNERSNRSRLNPARQSPHELVEKLQSVVVRLHAKLLVAAVRVRLAR
jgi:hypothetical protein